MSLELERAPLLLHHHDNASVSGEPSNEDGRRHGFGDDGNGAPKENKRIGVVSAMFLIFNRMIGTGIYATPSLILRLSGSVGMALSIWVIGSLVAAAGTAVYVELGTGLPRSGGEKNYLEFMYRRPKYLITCVYAIVAIFLSNSASNAVVFGEYTLHALSLPPSQFSIRLAALFPLAFATYLHITRPTLGLRIQNAIGSVMLFILASIPVCGFLSLLNVPGFKVIDATREAHNFDWDKIWEGTKWEPNALVTALYSVMWTFVGYSNANYALSEAHDPVRLLQIAAPLAVFILTVIFLLVNVAYLIVVPKADIIEGGRVVASLFFRRLFGDATERALSAGIAISTLGNILAVTFSCGRVLQELGREGVIPFSSSFSSNKPYNTPLWGIFWQFVTGAALTLTVPSGDAFNFTINLCSYPLSIFNAMIAFALLLYKLDIKFDFSFGFGRRQPELTSSASSSTSRSNITQWSPPYQTWTITTAFFLIANIILTVVPIIPPTAANAIYERLPYWSHVVVSILVMLGGVLYWYVWGVWGPKQGGYELVDQVVADEYDGTTRTVFRKVYAGTKPQD